MKIVKCGKCGAQFDVAAMKPGSQFACGKCRGPVSVPAESPPETVMLTPDQMQKALTDANAAKSAPAASSPKTQPKLPAAMQARAQAAAGGTTRAVGAAESVAQPAVAVQTATAPAARPTAKRGPRPQAEGEAAPKPPVAMYVSIIGGVACLGVVAFIFLSGKKDETAKTPDMPKSVEPTKPVEPARPKDPTNFDDYLSMPFPDQHDALVSRFAASSTDLLKLKEFYGWTTDPKVAQNGEAKAQAARILAKALEIDPGSEWAHTGRGDHKVKEFLEACKNECKESFNRADPDEKAVLERLKTVETQPWSDAAEWGKFQEAVARIRAREDRMKADPRFLEAERKRNWVKENPIFREVEMTWIFADPYVIFQEVKKKDVRDTKRVYDDKFGAWKEVPIDGTENPSHVKQNREWALKAENFAKRDAIIFTELNRRFRELFAAEYKLPELKEKGRMLTGLVMWNRQSFDKLLKEAGQTVSPGIRAFYSPPQQKIFHYLGDETFQEADEIPAEGGFVQKLSDQVTFHEGTHQLQHEYSAIYRGTPLKDNDTKVDDRKAMWFEEGMAEFLGAAEVEIGKTEYLDNVHWRHNRILLERIQESRRDRDGTEAWRIKDFLKPNHNGELMTAGQKLRPNNGAMSSHFYCRAWAFCHFLWNYDNGKYKQRFLDYLKEVMAGTQSSEKFATKIMKRPSINDWGDVEMEYEWYWKQLLLRKVEKSRITKQWSVAGTDAPTGKVEEDADFIETWRESHKDDKKKDK